jgi:HPt (histidine-containing phosphotransfer) domain-containing protein
MTENSLLASEVTLEDLIEMVGDDAEMIKEVADSFLDDAPRLLQAIQEGLTTKNAELVERSAHTIKSSSRIFRAEQFARQCQTLEDLARADDWSAIESTSCQLFEDYQVIADALNLKLSQL